jgi:hypothetical protein
LQSSVTPIPFSSSEHVFAPGMTGAVLHVPAAYPLTIQATEQFPMVRKINTIKTAITIIAIMRIFFLSNFILILSWFEYKNLT